MSEVVRERRKLFPFPFPALGSAPDARCPTPDPSLGAPLPSPAGPTGHPSSALREVVSPAELVITRHTTPRHRGREVSEARPSAG